MVNTIKKAIAWYLKQASKTDVSTPSGMIPLKYVLNGNV